MGLWAGRVRIALLAELVVIAVLVLDRVADVDWSQGSVPAVRGLLLVAAVVVAGICYQTWSTNPPRTPLVVSAAVVSLVGGAAFASSVTSAPHGEVLSNGPLPLVGLFATIALTLESRTRSARP